MNEMLEMDETDEWFEIDTWLGTTAPEFPPAIEV